jgi:hypothetical protein
LIGLINQLINRLLAGWRVDLEMTWPDKELEGKERVKARDRVCNWMRAHSGFFNRGEGEKKKSSPIYSSPPVIATPERCRQGPTEVSVIPLSVTKSGRLLGTEQSDLRPATCYMGVRKLYIMEKDSW